MIKGINFFSQNVFRPKPNMALTARHSLVGSLASRGGKHLMNGQAKNSHSFSGIPRKNKNSYYLKKMNNAF